MSFTNSFKGIYGVQDQTQNKGEWNMKKTLSLVVVMMMILMATPAYAATMDIVETAADSGNFTVLLAALDAAELTGALKGAGPFTVFAPTDAAFTALLAELGIEAADLLAHPQLADVLLYHVVSGQVESTDLVDGADVETLLGENITIDLDGGAKIIDATGGVANVTVADVMTTNGVIHVIDKVLVPDSFVLSTGPEMDIVEIALGNADFSTLVAALQKANLVGALQGPGPFTVFAPTNDAFASLLAALGISAEDLLAQPDLAKVLLYHVVSGKVMSTDLADGEVPTLNDGKTVTISLNDGVNVNDATVTTADIEATNGVIHVINSVLVPDNFTLAEVSEEPPISQTGDTLIYGIGALIILGGVLLLLSRRRGVCSQ